MSRSCCAPSAICTQAVYLKNSWTQEQKRTRKTHGQQRVYLVYILFRAFLAVAGRGVPGIPVTKIRCDSHLHRWATKIQPIDVSEDHVQHPIVWQLQMFRERETMITPSEQDQDPPSEVFLYICDYLCRKSQYHQLPLWDNRPRDHRSVEYAKANLLLYYLLIYTGRIQGYIRTPIRVPSWVLRLQSYIVACGYLVDKYVTLCLIIT